MKQAINFIFGTPCENCDTRTRNKVGIKGSPIDAILCEGCLIKWIRSLKMTKNEDLKAFVINDNGDYEWIARSETPNIDVPIAEICELLNTLSDILSPANKVYDGKYFSDKHCVSRDVIDFIDRLPANGFQIIRPTVTPTDGDAERALAWFNDHVKDDEIFLENGGGHKRDDYAEILKRKAHYQTIRAALQSTRKQTGGDKDAG